MECQQGFERCSYILDVTLEDSTNFSQALYIWSWQAEAQADRIAWIREIVK